LTSIDPGHATDDVFAAVFTRLKAMASRQRARAGGTLNTIALMHELYLKLGSSRELNFSSPAQFFDYAAQAMRHILVDRAREQMSLRRGAGKEVLAADSATFALADGTAERTLRMRVS
jgi:hypothetical protein